jgi:Uma2 family endonuclease
MTSALQPAESYVLLDDVEWETFVALVDDLGDGRGCRFAYDEGTLEIMAPGPRHEITKKLLARLVEAFTLVLDIPLKSCGSTLWKQESLRKALEPDECYYLASEPAVRGKLDLDLAVDPPPDLAIEVEITRGSALKLGIYAALGVAEVWRFNGSKVTVHRLQVDGTYRVADRSQVLPALPLPALQRFMALAATTGETELLRQFQAWVQERFSG